MGLLKPLHDYVDALVHPSARGDALAVARHRLFIAQRLYGGLALLALIPFYLSVRGVPSALEASFFTFLVVPIALGYALARTGRYDAVHVAWAAALIGLIVVIAAQTGGMGSFAAAWLVLVPLEAALSAARRAAFAAGAFAIAGAGALMFLVPQASTPAGGLALFGLVAAAIYAAALALGQRTLLQQMLHQHVREQEHHYLLAASASEIVTRHGRHGAVRFVSPAAERLFQTPLHELSGHGLFDRIHVADRPLYLTALADAAAGESRCVELRVRVDPAQASRLPCFLWMEMRCRPGPNAGEAVCVMRDISERKLLEQTIAQARGEAQQAEAAKSHFLATMSHELRTPLNAIIGFSQMLTKESQIVLSAERRQDYAKLINESGHHLLSIVNSILDMSKMEAGDFEIAADPFAPAVVIENCCDLLALQARESGVELRKTVPADLPELIGDKRAFKQIMLNLLSNAIKFTDRGGHAGISARRDGNALVVTVEDSGIGISAEDLASLGRPFFQVGKSYARPHDGTGLGLSIVKGLVALHHGEMSVDSELGRGTRIVVRLPLDRRDAVMDNGVADLAARRSAHDRTIEPIGMKKIA